MEKLLDAKKVYSVADNTEADIIIEFLKSNDISAYKSGQGNSDFMNVYSGNSTQGVDIMVLDENFSVASLLLSDYKDASKNQPALPKSKLIKVSQIIILIMVVLFVVLVIFTIFL